MLHIFFHHSVGHTAVSSDAPKKLVRSQAMQGTNWKSLMQSIQKYTVYNIYIYIIHVYIRIHSKQLRLFDHTTLATFLFWFVFEWSKSRVGRFPPLNYAAWQENSGLHNHLVEWRFDEACHNPQESVMSDLYTLRIGVIHWHLRLAVCGWISNGAICIS